MTKGKLEIILLDCKWIIMRCRESNGAYMRIYSEICFLTFEFFGLFNNETNTLCDIIFSWRGRGMEYRKMGEKSIAFG